MKQSDKIENYFFYDLIKFRKLKGISKNDIVKKSKINIKYIDAIESGNFKIIPTIYTKLFLKSYAKSIQYDEKKILSSYDDYINNVKKKNITSKIPKYMKNKKSINIRNKVSRDQNQSYLIDIKKIIFFILSMSFVLLCWLVFIFIFNNKQESTTENKLEWRKDFESSNSYEIEYILIKNINDNNKIEISSIKNHSKFIIINEKGKIEATKILNKGEKYIKEFSGKIEIGFKNYNRFVFNINNQIINSTNSNRKKIFILDPSNNLESITVKHIKIN